jgi:hypothetical protein
MLREVIAGVAQESPLDVERCHMPQMLRRQRPAERAISRDRLHRLDRFYERHIFGDEVVFEHAQNELSGPDLEEPGILRHVCVTRDRVQAAIMARTCMRLVARIDDRPMFSRLDAHRRLEEVRPL